MTTTSEAEAIKKGITMTMIANRMFRAPDQASLCL